jgi:colanic acid/amylovoran biosynthesis protein
VEVLVTGLTLQGNKGGAALAQSLSALLGRRFENLTITFAVWKGPDFWRETMWAEEFGVAVVERFVYADLLGFDALRSLPSRLAAAASWAKTLRGVDLVVDLSALSYVGPPTAGKRKIYRNSRFSYFLSALLAGKPFLAWTQSYGPFTTPLLRTMARLDLGRQPAVFCRGEKSQQAVRALIRGKTTFSFPDAATTLPYSREEGDRSVEAIWGERDGKTASLTPSAALYARNTGRGRKEAHLEELVSVCSRLLSKGYRVLLVPHTYREGCGDAGRCDGKLCDLLLHRLGKEQQVRKVEGDRSPSELKAIISLSHIHLSARYHSLVAGLSSGVPSIALSWHHKYRDLMVQYGVAEFLCEESCQDAAELCRLFEKLEERRDKIHLLLHERQIEVVSAVERNADLFADLIRKATA